MRLKSTKVLYAYWEELRGARVAPRRFEIEPSRIADILPDTFILEKSGKNQFRFRLAGTRVCDRLGAQFRGADFLRCWSKDSQSAILRGLEVVGEHGAILVAEVEASYTHGESARFEFLVLPLFHTGDSIDRFMGVISTTAPVAKLDGSALGTLKLVKTSLEWPTKDVRQPSEVDPAAPMVFEPHVRNARVVRHAQRSFRVYEGGLSEKNKRD